MRWKEIEKIPFAAKERKDSFEIKAAVHTVAGEEVLLVDVCEKNGKVRICLTKRTFKNYFPEEKCWDQRMIDNLPLLWSCARKKEYIDKTSREIIFDFTGGWSPKWDISVRHCERDIRQEEYARAEERRQQRIEKRMKTVPKEPVGFRRWVEKEMERYGHMTYPAFMNRKETFGTCTKCGNKSSYLRGEIRTSQKIKCKNCESLVMAKRISRNLTDYEIKNLAWDYREEFVLFQKTPEGFVERHYVARKRVHAEYEKLEIDEYARKFLIKQGVYDYFKFYSGWTDDSYWSDRNLPGMYNVKIGIGKVYPRTLTRELLQGSEYQYSGLELMKKDVQDVIRYLEKYRVNPEIEILVKMGLRRLAIEFNSYRVKQDGKKPWERLGVTKKQINRLIEINGGWKAVEWMKYENEVARAIDNKDIRWLEDNGLLPNRLEFITGRMTEKRICNYLKRQCALSGRSPQDMAITWEDYLSMAKRIKMDITKELIFKPKDLRKSHNDAVKMLGGVEIAKRAAEVGSKFPDADDICKSVIDKYQYADKDYSVICPEKIEDIIREGMILGHCLGKSDIYFERINRRETYIVFLRKTEELEKPYYSMEIEPSGTVRAVRTTGDNSGPDIKEVRRFIKKWQKAIQKRLSQEDMQLADMSTMARIAGYADLREKKTKIWRGPLAGRLLVEVLEEDLMEVRKREKHHAS